MTDQNDYYEEQGLILAIQRYIYDFAETGGVVEANLDQSGGWFNMALADYLAKTLLKYDWIKYD